LAHSFLGGNFFMQRMLASDRSVLGVEALVGELDPAARRTLRHLETEAASLDVTGTRSSERSLVADITVSNLAGHKLPTAYPSRRAWLHVVVTDANRRVVFESGAITPTGAIAGNDNDEDASRYEPHHRVVTNPGQVQVYEAVMGDTHGAVTTGLLTAVRYLKDNRLLPSGFDKGTASKDVAVVGDALLDESFVAGHDRVRFEMGVGDAPGPLTVVVELNYQSIAFRWARNLGAHTTPEASRFLSYYDAMAAGSAATLARATIIVP
jgi:hypothetical protein